MAEKKPKKSGLGKGLNALFSEPAGEIVSGIDNIGAQENEKKVSIIPLVDIEPNKNQPRKNFEEDKLVALCESIKEHGVVSPIIVTPTQNGTYKIVAGERRWRASKMAELHEIPCIIRDFKEQQVMEIALVENLQREDLNPIEEAEGYLQLMNAFSLTQEEIASRVGKSRSAVANSLRLNNLCKTVKEYVQSEKLTQGHARALLTLNEEQQIELAEKIIENNLNVRQAEALAQNVASGKKGTVKKHTNPLMQKFYKELEGDLSSRFGTKVKISETSKKGKIEIEYYSKDDLERILFELRR